MQLGLQVKTFMVDELQPLLESEPLQSHLMATPDEQAEYERLFAWRERWQRLARNDESGRLQSRQERIERRAAQCNSQIRALMRRYDARVGNAVNPV